MLPCDRLRWKLLLCSRWKVFVFICFCRHFQQDVLDFLFAFVLTLILNCSNIVVSAAFHCNFFMIVPLSRPNYYLCKEYLWISIFLTNTAKIFCTRRHMCKWTFNTENTSITCRLNHLYLLLYSSWSMCRSLYLEHEGIEFLIYVCNKSCLNVLITPK